MQANTKQQKIEINAAILERSPDAIISKVFLSMELVDVVQVDVCDGRFVPSKTFMSAGCPSSTKWLREIAKDVRLELDMMIDWDTPIKGRFKKWLTALSTVSPYRAVLHIGSTENWQDIFNYIKAKGIKSEIGLGIHLNHSVDKVLKLLKEYPFSYVQIMGIEKVGYGGQDMSPKVFDIIKELHSAKPSIPIAIDGGVKLENAAELVEAGATRLALGSGLFDVMDVSKRAAELRDATA